MDTKSWTKGLPPRAREALEAGRQMRPAAGESQSVWAELAEKLPVASATAATSAASGGITALSLLKPVGAGLALGLITASGASLLQSSVPSPHETLASGRAAGSVAQPAGTQPRSLVTAARSASLASDSSSARRPAQPVPTAEPAATAAPPRAPSGPSAAAFPADAPPSTLPPNAVLLESNRVARVRALLQQGNVGEVLNQLAELDRLFAVGVLRQERDALRVEALLRSGDRAAAHDEALRFLARYPHSPHGAAVGRALR
jgi:hypothetical protein